MRPAYIFAVHQVKTTLVHLPVNGAELLLVSSHSSTSDLLQVISVIELGVLVLGVCAKTTITNVKAVSRQDGYELL